MGEIASCRRQWPARKNTVIHVDADPCVLGANFLPDLPILGDATEVLVLILDELERKGVKPNQRLTHGRLHDPSLRAELKTAHESLLAQIRAEAAELPRVDQCPLYEDPLSSTFYFPPRGPAFGYNVYFRFVNVLWWHSFRISLTGCISYPFFILFFAAAQHRFAIWVVHCASKGIAS